MKNLGVVAALILVASACSSTTAVEPTYSGAWDATIELCSAASPARGLILQDLGEWSEEALVAYDAGNTAFTLLVEAEGQAKDATIRALFGKWQGAIIGAQDAIEKQLVLVQDFEDNGGTEPWINAVVAAEVQCERAFAYQDEIFRRHGS